MAPRRSARVKTLAASKANQAPALPGFQEVKQQLKSTKPKAREPKTTTTTTTTTTPPRGKKGKGGGVTKTKKKPTSTTKPKDKKTTTTKKNNAKTITCRIPSRTPPTSASPAKISPVKDLATTLQSRATEAMANIARKVSSSAEAIASPKNNLSSTGSPSRKQSGALAKAAEVISPNKNDRARTPGRRAASSPSPGKSGVGSGAGTGGKGRAKSEGRA